jgi:hypothetical protein
MMEPIGSSVKSATVTSKATGTKTDLGIDADANFRPVIRQVQAQASPCLGNGEIRLWSTHMI